MKHVLLIGGAGFIGSNVVAELYKRGTWELFVLEPEFASISRIKHLPVKVIRGAISDIDMLQSLLLKESIDTVVHLVSTIVPGSDYEDFKKEFTNVIFPSIRLMELCCKMNIRFVYFSSGGTIYGNRDNLTSPFVETDPMAPISYYGWSKQMMENSILYMNRTQGLRYLILRPSNPYGHGQSLFGKQGFIAVALGRILAGKTITVWGDGSFVRDYVYIDDLSHATADLLMNENIVDMTLNLGSGIGYSVNDIIEVIRETVSENVGVEYLPARKADVSSVILDISKVRELIPFFPMDINQGIKRFYEDIKAGI